MADTPANIHVVERPAEHRYEIYLNDELAGLTTYEDRAPETRTFIHTEIDEAFGGHGLAGILVTYALDDMRSRGWHIVPVCPYVASWLTKHPDYADLLAPTAGLV
jgi:predicted GNAT family acetyltransferase